MKTFLRTSLALLAAWPFAVTVPTQAQLIAGPQNNGTPKIDFDATVQQVAAQLRGPIGSKIGLTYRRSASNNRSKFH